jgi:hypothetical protein
MSDLRKTQNSETRTLCRLQKQSVCLIEFRNIDRLLSVAHGLNDSRSRPRHRDSARQIFIPVVILVILQIFC